MLESTINNLAYWYEKKIDMARNFQLGKALTKKNYYMNDFKKEIEKEKQNCSTGTNKESNNERKLDFSK